MVTGELIMNEKNHHCFKPKDHFTLTERILMRAGWGGFMLTGFFGIYKQDPIWAWGYAVLGILGFLMLVIPFLCVHCPYPYHYSTCLFIPPGFLKRFYPYRGPKMSAFGKIAVFVVLACMVVLPNLWLVTDLPLLLLFWIFGLPTIASFPAYYCKQCRHTGCPMNSLATCKNSSAD
jgi:hypothetical protein